MVCGNGILPVSPLRTVLRQECSSQIWIALSCLEEFFEQHKVPIASCLTEDFVTVVQEISCNSLIRKSNISSHRFTVLPHNLSASDHQYHFIEECRTTQCRLKVLILRRLSIVEMLFRLIRCLTAIQTELSKKPGVWRLHLSRSTMQATMKDYFLTFIKEELLDATSEERSISFRSALDSLVLPICFPNQAQT